MRRANTSITKATYNQPGQVETYVKSDTHNWFGRSACLCRSTRSVEHGALASPTVVRTTSEGLAMHPRIKVCAYYKQVQATKTSKYFREARAWCGHLRRQAGKWRKKSGGP